MSSKGKVIVFSLWIAFVGFGAQAGGEEKPKAEASTPATAAAASKKDPNEDIRADALIAYHQKRYRDAMRLFQPLAEKGDIEAQYYVGRMYEKGQGVKKNEEEMVKWYKRSAEGGYAAAQYRMAAGYGYGLGGLKQDDKEAVKWLQRAAEGNYKRAQKALSQAYAKGSHGLPKDPEKAEYWKKKSEENS